MSGTTRLGGLWHHPDFRRLWIAETVSKFGTSVSQIALPLVAILVVEASTFEVGLLLTFETLAFLVVGLPAGAWVDRMRMRNVLIVNDVLRAVAMASVPLAAWLGGLGMPQLYVVALVVGVSTVFFDVANQSYLPSLVAREDLVEGNAKLTASESIALISGPGLAGVLIQVLTAPYAILIDAVSFLWSASWVTAIKHRSPKPAPKPDRHLGREIAEGVRFVLGNRLLRSIAMCTGTSNLFNAMGQAVFLLLLARELDLSPGLIGLLTSVSAFGALAGSFLARRVADWLGQGPTIWISVLVAAPFGFVLPFVQRDWSLALLAFAQLIFMTSVVIYNVAQVSFRQGLTPPALLGRMNATMRFVVWGTMPLGAFVGGILGSTIGIRETLFVSAAGMALSWLPVFFSPLRTMRELPQYVEPELEIRPEGASS
ncbi:MAG TPA: MFS transporter [Nocardioidaceae bacterium]|nr:MFS transporter [Nocardioidaceae bacterium]